MRATLALAILSKHFWTLRMLTSKLGLFPRSYRVANPLLLSKWSFVCNYCCKSTLELAIFVHHTWPEKIGSAITVRNVEVMKAGEEIQFTAKGFNGRVILEWLTHCLSDAMGSPAIADPRLGLTYAAMTLILIVFYFASLFRELIWSFLILCLLFMHVCSQCWQVRNHLATFFGLMERNPRFLCLWCIKLVSGVRCAKGVVWKAQWFATVIILCSFEVAWGLSENVSFWTYVCQAALGACEEIIWVSWMYNLC